MTASDGSPRTKCAAWRHCRSRSPTGSGGRCWSPPPAPPIGARSRVRTTSGAWLLLYGTRLAGKADDRTAVIIQPATPAAVAPLVTLAYGLSERESQVTLLCMQGVSTRQMAHALALSPHTVQDHLKSIFAKTGVRSRSELVGQIFLEHYVTRWEDLADVPTGWLGKASPIPVGMDPAPSPRELSSEYL